MTAEPMHDAHVREWVRARPDAAHAAGITLPTEPTEAPRDAARRLARSMIRGTFRGEALHVYTWPTGAPWYWRIRAREAAGVKWIRPMRRTADGLGFELGEPHFPRAGKPLYALGAIAAQPGAPVWFVEGEACADALAKLGVVATTAGGATSDDRADFSPLRGRTVTIWPDHDAAGGQHGVRVATRLRALGCTVETIDAAALALAAGGDAADWLAAHPAATVADLATLPRVRETPPEPTPPASETARADDMPPPCSEVAETKRVRVQIGRSLRVSATDAVLRVLRTRSELYDFGDGAVAFVAEGRARAVGAEWLVDHLGRVCDFFSERATRDGVVHEQAEDAPAPIARAILAKHDARGFRRLVAVVTAPTLRADGSVLDVPGYDDASRLLYCAGSEAPRVPAAPTPADALAALRVLWRPYREFPAVDDVDRGVILHALLTATVRASLPTAPGIALDAPAAGTGKTLAAKCVGILATGTDPAILPPAEADEEVRKRLFAALRDGHRVLLWDNVREPLGYAALDAFLTAATFADRVLGVSETIALPNRALFIATGNNIRLTGDTCRRILVARLDAQVAQPYAREFDFDPHAICTRDRLSLVVAALTIIRAWIVAGRPKAASGRTASFEVWDDLVRQPICWLADLVRKAGAADLPALADPLGSAKRAYESDPETTKLAALLAAWNKVFASAPTTVATAIARADTHDELRVALDEIAGQGAGRINPRILGRWIERHVGRRIVESHDDVCSAERRFERGKLRDGLTTWIVSTDPARVVGPGKKPTETHLPTSDPAAKSGEVGVSGFVSGLGTARTRGADPAAVVEVDL